MITVNLNTLELMEFTAMEDKQQHCKAAFPLIGMHGSKELATVLIELAPGDNLGRHTDSAEELLVVLEGEVTATIGDDQVAITQGSISLVPKLVPHDLRNTGDRNARVLGVFGGANNIVATFDNEWNPTGSNVVDTSQLL